jgi:hypothetical protein
MEMSVGVQIFSPRFLAMRDRLVFCGEQRNGITLAGDVGSGTGSSDPLHASANSFECGRIKSSCIPEGVTLMSDESYPGTASSKLLNQSVIGRFKTGH